MKAPIQAPKSFSSAASSAPTQRKGGLKTIVDNRPLAIAQRKLQGVVQRAINPIGGNISKEAATVIDKIDNYVQIVHAKLLVDTFLSGYSDLDGHTRGWVKKVKKFSEQYHDNKSSFSDIKKHMYMKAGYVIESIACNLIGNQMDGFEIAFQVAKNKTRPDIVMTKGDENIWVDITSTGDKNHVLRKDGDWKGKPSLEITYPSFTDSALMIMLESPGIAANGEEFPYKEIVDSSTKVDIHNKKIEAKVDYVLDCLLSLQEEMPGKKPQAARMQYLRKEWEQAFKEMGPQQLMSVIMATGFKSPKYFNYKGFNATSTNGKMIIDKLIEDDNVELDEKKIREDNYRKVFELYGTKLVKSQTPAKEKSKPFFEKGSVEPKRKSLGNRPKPSSDTIFESKNVLDSKGEYSLNS